ncbi:MAG TPA: hypothetical protein VGR89_14970, partial [Puia sp.]|nr:hypothetical protein [Puia sp.]
DLEQNSKDKSGLGKTPATMVEVMKLLREHHINWVAGMRSGYAFGALTPAPDSSIIITAHSEAELQSLHALLSPLSGITASIGQVEFEPMPDRVTRYKIMYQRALADATGMATVSGKTLGELISVEEPQDLLWSSIRDMTQGMEMTANIFAALAGRSPGRLRKTVETKMLFKFELK